MRLIFYYFQSYFINSNCNTFIDKETGQVSPITDEIKEYANHQINEMNKKMKRTLYICYRDITEEEYNSCELPDNDGLLHL